MVEVKVTDKNGFEKAMRIFKKQCQKEGFLVELKERRYYSKPSERKRRKKVPKLPSILQHWQKNERVFFLTNPKDSRG